MYFSRKLRKDFKQRREMVFMGFLINFSVWNDLTFILKLQREYRESSYTFYQLPLMVTSYITMIHFSKLQT